MKKVLRVFGRGLLVLLALVMVLGLGLAGFVAFDAVTSPGVQALTNTNYPAKDGRILRGYVARPAGPGPHPAIVMIHEFYGLNKDIIAKADKLAAEGYVVLAPDAYRGQTTAAVPRAIYLVSSTPAEQINNDMDSAYAWLVQQKDVDNRRTAVMGFCFGGGFSLRLGLRQPNLAATVVFYGALVTDPASLGDLRGPVLGIFGENDRAPSPEQARGFQSALNTRGIKNEISIYPGVGHAFLDSVNITQPGPAQDAWRQLLAFLDANVKRPSGR